MMVQEYRITETITLWGYVDRILPAGSFVKPINVDYLPSHIKVPLGFNNEELLYCYTYYGIVPIPRNKIRKA